MELPEDSVRPIVNRLKRARGQLSGIIDMLEDGRDCEDVVTQIAAVSKALDRAGYSAVAAGLRQCLVDGNELDAQKMERVFLSLA